MVFARRANDEDVDVDADVCVCVCRQRAQTAQCLGLSEHAVLGGRGQGVLRQWFAMDSEVHLGADNRLYLVDLARLAPPAPPPAGDRGNRYLYDHLRPELLVSTDFRAQCQGGRAGLSSDAFSPFAGERSGWCACVSASVRLCTSVHAHVCMCIHTLHAKRALTDCASGVHVFGGAAQVAENPNDACGASVCDMRG